MPVCMFGNQASTKTVLRRFLCIVNVPLDTVLRSHPCCERQSLRPRGMARGLDGWETRGATCHWTQSCSISVGGQCVRARALCAPMSVSVSMLMYMCWKINSHTEMCAATACSCLWVYAAHMDWNMEPGQEREQKRETVELQVTSKIKVMRKSRHLWGCGCAPLPFCYRLKQFTQAVPKRSEHFLPDGCETLLRSPQHELAAASSPLLISFPPLFGKTWLTWQQTPQQS